MNGSRLAARALFAHPHAHAELTSLRLAIHSDRDTGRDVPFHDSEHER